MEWNGMENPWTGGGGGGGGGGGSGISLWHRKTNGRNNQSPQEWNGREWPDELALTNGMMDLPDQTGEWSGSVRRIGDVDPLIEFSRDLSQSSLLLILCLLA
jgi:hypothetical protein